MFLDLAVLPAGLQLEEGTIYIKGLRINKVHNNIAIINISMAFFGGGGFLYILVYFNRRYLFCHNLMCSPNPKFCLHHMDRFAKILMSVKKRWLNTTVHELMKIPLSESHKKHLLK